MQGKWSALVNLSSLDFDKRLDWNGEEIRAPVHDELVVQALRESALEVKIWTGECMTLPAQISETYAEIPALGDMDFN